MRKGKKTGITPGYRIGKLVVREPSGGRKNGYIIWNCQCDCGGSICLDTRALQRGTIQNCGCEPGVKSVRKDLTGRRFGRLVCIEPDPTEKNPRGVVWRCRCDCGNDCLAVSSQLLKGYKKSCGCLSHPPLKDLVGKRFGRLTVLAYEGKRNGMHRWRCRCDCGRETVVGQTLLQSGKTKSCGCLRKEQIRNNLQLEEGTSVTILEANKKRTIASNTSGYTGVYRKKNTGCWIAQIGFKNKMYYLGSFEKKEDAVTARKQSEEIYEDFLERYYRSGLREETDFGEFLDHVKRAEEK